MVGKASTTTKRQRVAQRVKEAGYSAFVYRDPSSPIPMSKTGAYGFTRTANSDGSQTITRRQVVALKKTGQSRKDMAKKTSSVNTATKKRNVRAHGVGDQFGGPARGNNFTMTSEEANKLDSFIEAKFKSKMQQDTKTHKAPQKYDMQVVETISTTGGRVEKVSRLQRQGSATELTADVKTKHE